MRNTLFNKLIDHKKAGKKSLAVLIDPDYANANDTEELIEKSTEAGTDYFFIGGSLILSNKTQEIIEIIRRKSTIPIFIFPGEPSQINTHADALLYLSLISGRNPELLIGQHVRSASWVKKSGLEIIPTGYMLIEGGKPTSVSYMSNTQPIPHDKNAIAVSTAMAGEMLGMKAIYMDAGSGAIEPVSTRMIKQVAQSVALPIIVGGGIRTAQTAYENCLAGADVVVIGNLLEKKPQQVYEISKAIANASKAIKATDQL